MPPSPSEPDGGDASDPSDSSERLKQAEERLHQALDSVGDGAWDWNIRSREVFYTDRWYESLGYARGELGAGPDVWAQLIHPEDDQLVRDALDAHIRGHTRNFDCEYRLRTTSGDYRWTQGRGRVVDRDADAKALRMVGTNTDISLAKQVQRSLDELEGLCRSIFDTAGCIMVVLDRDYLIREWNPTAERIYGWKRDEVHGRDYVGWFLPEAYRQPVKDEIDRLLAGGEATENYENPIITRNGSERDVLWNASQLTNSAGERWAVVAIGQDITERKRVERERDMARLESELLRERQS